MELIKKEKVPLRQQGTHKRKVSSTEKPEDHTRSAHIDTLTYCCTRIMHSLQNNTHSKYINFLRVDFNAIKINRTRRFLFGFN